LGRGLRQWHLDARPLPGLVADAAARQPVNQPEVVEQAVNETEGNQQSDEPRPYRRSLTEAVSRHEPCSTRQLRNARQRLAERHVETRASVHGPAVRVQNGTEVALSQLEPCDQHGRPGNDEHEHGNRDAELPERQSHQTAGIARNRRRCRRERAESDAERRDGPDVDLLRLLGLRLVDRRNGLGNRLELLRGGSIGGGSALRDLLLYEPHELLVWGPERLPDTDRVVDDLRDRRIPVSAFAVIENAVPPDHQIVRVAVRDGRDDLLLLARRAPRDVAVEEIRARHRHHGRRLRGVIDVERQLAASLIDIERAGLKDRLLAARVELLEVDEVLAEILEVAAIADEPVDALDQRGGAGLCRITLDQRTQSLLGLTARDLLEPLRRERGALGRGELGAPLDVG